MNKSIMKIIGVATVVLGSGALFVSGAGESVVVALVGGVFVVAGIIVSLFKA